jgi:glycoprotein endo-alpha-1,2-mannosidase
MKFEIKSLIAIVLLIGLCSCSCKEEKVVVPPVVEGPVAVTKTNTDKIFMHYMPWFHSKEVSGYWGSHWKMNNKNPEVILPNGQREIASHYYPLVGPYDSSDPDLVDYHLLLMKYAGVDAILIDWYGSYNILDYGSNLKNTNAVIAGAKRVGLDFAVVYEDNTAYEVERRKDVTALQAAQEDMKYLQQHYFSSGHYVMIEDKPLLMTFGPRYFLLPADWTAITSVLTKKPSLFPLWKHGHRTGTANTSGEFSWVDFNTSLPELDQFYKATNAGLRMGSAYPGFRDYYQEGGWGDGYGFVDHANGASLDRTLEKFDASGKTYLQLVTWNDFGEGTMIEPTVEFQYKYVERIQTYAGVSYTKAELETIHSYYVKRKEFKGNAEKQEILDDVFTKLIHLEVQAANELLLNL